MRKFWGPATFLILLSVPALSATPAPQGIPFPNTRDSVVIPVGTSIRYFGIRNREGEPVAIFQGRLMLAGTYYYGDNEFNDSGDEKPSDYRFDPEAYIIPDADTVARLPHFAIRNRRPYTILINNPNAFAKAVLSRTAQRRVRCRNCGVASGHIAIWVDQFSAGIVCDAPDYEVRFLSIYMAAHSAMMPKPNRAC